MKGATGIGAPMPPLNENSPFALVPTVSRRGCTPTLLWNVTVEPATGVVALPSNTRPVTVPVMAGKGVTMLMPSAGTAKLAIVRASSGSIASSASGGSCARRCAEASAPW